MIKAIFFDIDGTLVSFRTHEISPKVMEDLYALRGKGIKLFIASGRHYLVMDNLQDFPFDGYISMNGSLVTVGGEVVSCRTLGADTARKVGLMCRQHGLPAVAFCRGSYGISMQNDLTRKTFEMIRLHDVPLYSWDSLVYEDVCQFTIFADRRQEKELFTEGLDSVTLSRWFPSFFDMNTKGLSKADGIAAVIERFGITADEVMAFGDGGNDSEMLKYAGTGIAMGNADDTARSAADYVTLTVDQDGISHALRHFGLL